ncbi:hypothetical protein [Stenotrophomonas sp. SY1]|uniref:hypothetical protein n=1 Tax=Stenotrophomonas sp. SY1 TaxID=477235 RepID=UPI001E3CDA85|nr:hypothetical protein [Stenotrophomonas sp. SY1]MCD9085248.1 hypothetical protein [Stenotrophomonas sp. SY1]
MTAGNHRSDCERNHCGTRMSFAAYAAPTTNCCNVICADCDTFESEKIQTTRFDSDVMHRIIAAMAGIKSRNMRIRAIARKQTTTSAGWQQRDR